MRLDRRRVGGCAAGSETLVRRKALQMRRKEEPTCNARTWGRSDAFMTRSTTPSGREVGRMTPSQLLALMVGVL